MLWDSPFYSLWGGGCGSFAVNEVTKGTKWNVVVAEIQNTSQVSTCWHSHRHNVERVMQTNRKPANERPDRHMRKDPDRYLHCHNFLLHHSAWGYTFTPSEDIWQHPHLERSDVTEIDVWIFIVPSVYLFIYFMFCIYELCPAWGAALRPVNLWMLYYGIIPSNNKQET